jgi:branched-subunit amino acid aminotransferase/4-amino-4-deoxychorismate lyase
MTDKENYIILNGELIPDSHPVIYQNNRSFCYGDGLFETMHAYGTEVQLADFHFARLFKGMQILKISMNDSIAQVKLLREIKRLLNRNKMFGGTRIRLAVFRNPGGLYTPDESEPSYLIETSTLKNNFYELNQKGLNVEIFPEMVKHPDPLSSFKTSSALLYVMAGIWARDNHYDDCLILNHKNTIIESHDSNLFVVKNEVLCTPSPAQGCLDGVMRKQILLMAKKIGIQTEENCILSEQTLLESEEIFFTNAIDGIIWVQAFRQRRYFNKMSKMLCEHLNKEVFNE